MWVLLWAVWDITIWTLSQTEPDIGLHWHWSGQTHTDQFVCPVDCLPQSVYIFDL